MSDDIVIPCRAGIVWRTNIGIEHSVIAWEVRDGELRPFILGYDCNPYRIDNEVEFGTFEDRSFSD